MTKYFPRTGDFGDKRRESNASRLKEEHHGWKKI